jgi:hypothetical protein
MKKVLQRFALLGFLAPLFVFAAPGDMASASSFIKNIIAFMNDTLVPAIFALGFLVFLWGMFQTFIFGGDDEEKQRKGKQIILYTVAGFVVMISLWGIVNLIAAGLGLTDGKIPLPDLMSFGKVK